MEGVFFWIGIIYILIAIIDKLERKNNEKYRQKVVATCKNCKCWFYDNARTYGYCTRHPKWERKVSSNFCSEFEKGKMQVNRKKREYR